MTGLGRKIDIVHNSLGVNIPDLQAMRKYLLNYTKLFRFARRDILLGDVNFTRRLWLPFSYESIEIFKCLV